MKIFLIYEEHMRLQGEQLAKLLRGTGTEVVTFLDIQENKLKPGTPKIRVTDEIIRSAEHYIVIPSFELTYSNNALMIIDACIEQTYEGIKRIIVAQFQPGKTGSSMLDNFAGSGAIHFYSDETDEEKKKKQMWYQFQRLLWGLGLAPRPDWKK